MRLRWIFLSFVIVFLATPLAFAFLQVESSSEEGRKEEVVEEQRQMSPEEATLFEKKIKNEVKKAIEEKKKIIKERSPQQKKPPLKKITYIVKKRTSTKKPVWQETKPLERHNILIGERPFIIVLTLFLLSLLTYILYRLILQRLSS